MMGYRCDFVDFDLLNRIVGVGPCHPQARSRVVLLTQTYEQRTPPAVVQGAAPDSRFDPQLVVGPNVLAAV